MVKMVEDRQQMSVKDELKIIGALATDDVTFGLKHPLALKSTFCHH